MHRLIPAFAEAVSAHAVLRYLLIFLGAVGICFFLLPVAFGIVNIGNVFGFAVSLLLLCFAACSRSLADRLRNVNGHTAGRVTVGILTAVLLLGICWCAVLSGMMLLGAAKKPGGSPKAAVVLGCKVRGTVPSLMLSRRIEKAYEMLMQYPEMIAVVSGGQGSNEDISEAECMAVELKRRGIPAERIVREDKSTSTSENLRFSKALLEERGITGEILIVTDGFHERRAQLLAKYEGLPQTAAASAYTSWYLMPTYVVREWFGLTHAFVFHS